MARKDVLYVSSCVMIIVSSLVFVYPAFTQIRAFWYYPTEHRWAFEARPSGVAMDWFWRSFLSIAFGAVAFVVAQAIVRRLKSISPRSFTLWAAWAGTAVILAGAVYTYQLAMRVPRPAPLPSWYVPK